MGQAFNKVFPELWAPNYVQPENHRIHWKMFKFKFMPKYINFSQLI
jgi:hypothetical protein